MKKLSVIVPVFNRLDLTKAVINDIFKKIYFLHDFELVIVDDGSTDGTRRWLEALSEAYRGTGTIKVITFPGNRGVSAGWNAGMAAATGQYCMVVNNDITMPHDLDKKLIDSYDGKPTCPFTKVGDGAPFYKTTNINGTCWLMKRSDWSEPIDTRVKLWYTDDFVFRRYGVTWVPEVFVEHLESQTLKTVENLSEILENDRIRWNEICGERGWA